MTNTEIRRRLFSLQRAGRESGLVPLWDKDTRLWKLEAPDGTLLFGKAKYNDAYHFAGGYGLGYQAAKDEARNA
jgi:hypothetical protein